MCRREYLNVVLIIILFLIYFIDYAITVAPFFRLHLPPPCTCLPIHIPPLQFMSMGHTYKFFGFYISYTILTLRLSIFYLPFMLLIPCTFSHSLSPSHSPVDNPPCDLHFCGSVSVLVVCLVCFFVCLFQVWLLITVSLLSFLLFILFIFFFLDKSL